jgi:hypothetical protein
LATFDAQRFRAEAAAEFKPEDHSSIAWLRRELAAAEKLQEERDAAARASKSELDPRSTTTGGNGGVEGSGSGGVDRGY